jgi:hypothetical protein
LLQVFRGVKLAGRLVYADGMKVCHSRKHLGLVTVPADNTAAISENAYDAAVLPVSSPVFVGQLNDAQEILGHLGRTLEIDAFWVRFPGFSLSFQIGNKAWPRATLQLIQ